MAKKKTLKKKKTFKQPKRIKRTHGEWLQHLIKVSNDAITTQGSSIDEFFTQQAVRLTRELETWKENAND